MSQYVAGSESGVPIESNDQLVGYFGDAFKPPTAWRIGTEYEKVAVLTGNGRAVPFTGGIEEILRRLAAKYSWQPIAEGGRIVALGGGGSAITLEPGGQLELSGEICDSVHCAKREFDEHVAQILDVTGDMTISFLGLGMQPISRTDEIEWVPKRRYSIMGPYMRKVGTLGLRMMLQTATVQVNFDYESEADAMRKLRVGMGLSPLFTAMFANSPLSDGALNGFRSYRAHVWTDTDSDRSGMLPFAFREDAGFRDYVEYALDVPMYFIVRGDEWIDMTRHTFRDFWRNGHAGHRATLDDWNAHLTTLFPEFRMKRYLEVRSCDSQSPELMLSVPALMKGIFYDSECLDAAWRLVADWTWEERQEISRAVPREALTARVRGIALRDLGIEILEIARRGLARAGRLDAAGRDESIYLEPLWQLTSAGRCPADEIIENWNGAWKRDVGRLIAGTAYQVKS